MVPHFSGVSAQKGVYVAGLAHLSSYSFGTTGLQQSVRGFIRGMKVLKLDPQEEGFGAVQDVPYGYRLRLDPDTIRQPFAFMMLDVTETGKLVYEPFSARLPEYPEPDLTGIEGQP
jgi:hypothetical protein